MSARLMSIEDLSDHLGVPINTLYKWRTKGYGPAGRRIGKYVRYRPEDVAAWIEAQGTA
ncbi:MULTISPECIES: helix-turn-helix domain-containing protein [unclassified Amycolatopsis]|uniref:helix-turn-helix transcriptional regulator n=1 Tax=unclassified Amycolatopsis TaxID=2618356 RepID=UPI002875E9F8|nr:MULTISPECIES: helix-turn-helix domain-containing protein [unclassified Amycolatopsis]MDS0137577.1 helix-turn-helix domain-containing protein [Amycolatopsis sp. 505]MDS0141772.1 helix-turn-helix domain-containing protein [Amycolatopsis sp. CM201R]